MIAHVGEEGKRGCPLWDEGQVWGDLLSAGLELDVLDGDVVEGAVEVVDRAHDGGVEAVGEDLGTEEAVNPWQRKCLRCAGFLSWGPLVYNNLQHGFGAASLRRGRLAG